MSRTHYEILGISRNAKESDIKKAYRNLAMKYHPDKNQGNPKAEKVFLEINNSYSVLSDESKKYQYDKELERKEKLSESSSFNSSMFKKSASPVKLKGEDSTALIRVPKDIARDGGVFKTLITVYNECTSCFGSGWDTKSPKMNCSKCKGVGHVRVRRSTNLGSYMAEEVCDLCNGSKKIHTTACKTCSGSGILESEQEVEINIGKGTEHLSSIVLKGMGKPSINGGEPGDLIVRVLIV